MEYVRVPKADWLAILDETRAKTGHSDPMISGEVAAEIAGIQTGGGGSGGGIQMASGEYVLTANTNSFSINIDDIGFVPDVAFVSLDETDMTYDGTPTKAWAMYRVPLLLDRTPISGAVSRTNLAHTWRGAQGTETVQNGPKTLHFIGIIKNTTSLGIKVSQTASGYPIIAGTYKWECYKIWEDE